MFSRHTPRTHGLKAVTVTHLTGQVIVPSGGRHRHRDTLAAHLADLLNDTPGVTA